MKKRFLMIFTAILALTGCSSQTPNSAPSAGSETDLAAEQVNSVAAITEIAWVTAEAPDEPLREPPQLQVTYSGDGLAACAAMTLGTYTWNDGEGVVCADSIGPAACAAEGRITAVVDLDTAAENEPKINLWAGAEMTGAELHPLDGETIRALDFTQDGVISFPADVYDGVVCVYAKFPEGNASYFFMVERSLTDPSQPPELRVFSGDYIGFKMTRGAYDWTYTENSETCTVTTDIASPWDMYQSGRVRPELWVLPNETLTVMLPEGAEMTAAEYRTSAESAQPLKISGGKLTMPQEQSAGVCTVSVKMPSGSCEYLFAVNIGESASSPAYEPVAE